jgi:peroxiredoxin
MSQEGNAGPVVDELDGEEEPQGEQEIGVAWRSIDAGFVAEVVPDLASVELDGETVVWVQGTGQIMWLDRRGTIVYRCIDGISSIGQICEDLAEAFDVDADTVLEDVVYFVQYFGRYGALVGVTEPEDPELDSLPVGTELPPFVYPDLEGRKVAFESFAGQRVLLVNWSPDCGFCRSLASPLGAMVPQLREHGVEMILLATGEREENRRLAKRSGLHCTYLLQGDALGYLPFALIGTPSAYLVDENHKVVEEMVIGSTSVQGLARRAIYGDTEQRRASAQTGVDEGHAGQAGSEAHAEHDHG